MQITREDNLIVAHWEEDVVIKRKFKSGIIEETVRQPREQLVYRVKRPQDAAVAFDAAWREVAECEQVGGLTLDSITKAAGRAVVRKQLSERPQKARKGPRRP